MPKTTLLHRPQKQKMLEWFKVNLFLIFTKLVAKRWQIILILCWFVTLSKTCHI